MPLDATAAYDVAVIGGGASGLTAAIAAARAGARVIVLERDVACGLPILVTGNGRCNLSNTRLDPDRYHRPEAARAVMGEAPEAAVAAFFTSLGLMTAEVDGRLYPVTRRAESVRDVLLAGCARAGVELLCGCEIADAVRVGECWSLRVHAPRRPVRFDGDVRRARKALAAAEMGGRELAASRIVLAVGGSSERVCGLFDLPHANEVPLLCPLACHLDMPVPVESAGLRALDGLRVEAALTLVRAGCALWREEGEALFRTYGISGIAAFNVSRRAESGDVVELDLFPHMETGALVGALRQREDAVGTFDGTDASWFDGVLARPLASVVLALDEADGLMAADGLRGDSITRCARLLKRLPLVVEGRAEERQAQVRRGGIPLAAVELKTLEVGPGLHACGESLDQDADCGGFNLAWAWLSGLRAGGAAAVSR